MDSILVFCLTFVLMLVGMDLITRINPIAHQVYRLAIQIAVIRPMRWATRQIRNWATWFLRWSGRNLWHLICYLGRQLRRFFWWVSAQVRIGAQRLVRWSRPHRARFTANLRGQIQRGIQWTRNQIKGRWPIAIWALACLVAAVMIAQSFLTAFDNILTGVGNTNWSFLGWIALAAVVIALVVWLFQSGGVGHVRRMRWSKWILVPVLALLAIMVVVSAYKYLPRAKTVIIAKIVPAPSTITPNSTNDITTKVIRPEQPVEAVMPQGWQMDGWGDETKFDSHVVWRDRDKVRIFTTKAGVEETEIKIRIYPCTPKAPC